MNWFTRLFKRKPKEVPQGIPAARTKWGPTPGPDIIARQGGQKRNRVHVYRQPFGYLIRFCDQHLQDKEGIEKVGEAQGTLGGPAEKEALAAALDWVEVNKRVRICKHCQAIVKGKRRPGNNITA